MSSKIYMGALERKTSMKITNDVLKKLIKEVIEEKITPASNKGNTLEETRRPRVDGLRVHNAVATLKCGKYSYRRPKTL